MVPGRADEHRESLAPGDHGVVPQQIHRLGHPDSFRLAETGAAIPEIPGLRQRPRASRR